MSASPLTPESPLGGRGGEGEKYTVLKEEEERDFKEGMVSAQVRRFYLFIPVLTHPLGDEGVGRNVGDG
jgi:hypothetical protein